MLILKIWKLILSKGVRVLYSLKLGNYNIEMRHVDNAENAVSERIEFFIF